MLLSAKGIGPLAPQTMYPAQDVSQIGAQVAIMTDQGTALRMTEAETTFLLIYERKQVQRSMKAEPAIVKFKSMTTLDLKGVMSKVKPGMVICNDQ